MKNNEFQFIKILLLSPDLRGQRKSGAISLVNKKGTYARAIHLCNQNKSADCQSKVQKEMTS